MAIARVMNMPDGSTPVPGLGGGDANGTLALSILNHQAGTGAIPIDQARHIVAQTTTMGIPNPVLVMSEQIPVTGATTLGGNE